MPLVADVAIEPSPDAVPVKLPSAAAAGRPDRSRKSRRAEQKEKTSVRRAVPRRSSRSGGGLVEEALAARDALKALLGRVRTLVGEARRQRQEHRVVRATLASLRQLQTFG